MMMNLRASALLLFAIVAILGVLAQLHGSITTDGSSLLLASPDPFGSLFFNEVDILDELNEMKVQYAAVLRLDLSSLRAGACCKCSSQSGSHSGLMALCSTVVSPWAD
jgi:hypothetical protein